MTHQPHRARPEASEECRHGLTVATCSYCKKAGPPVYVTGGGTRYHRTASCIALFEGQANVTARGGVPDEIRSVLPGAAILDDRSACKTCRPKADR